MTRQPGLVDTTAALLNLANEEAIRQVRSLLDCLQEGVWVIDRRDRTTLVNQRMAEMLGRSADEIVGRSLFDFMTPAEADRCRQLLGRRRSGMREQHDFTFLRADGSSLEALVEAAPLQDEDGEYRGAIAGIVDITTRREMERELERAEALQRETGHLAKVGGWEADLQTGLLRWTDELYAIHDLEAGQAVTLQQAGRFVVEPYRQPAHEAIQRAIRQAEPFDMELEIQTPAGSRKWLHFLGRPVLSDGRVVGLRGTLQDITERRQMEYQLLQAQKMEAIGHLAGGVAHDFRNQLQVIKGFSELLLREGHVAEEGKELLDEVLQAVERSTQLTTALLAFGRREMLRPKVVELSEIVRELTKSLSRIIGEDIRLVVTPCDRPCRANVDPAQLQQALMNLVVNAREAMPDGGTLEIWTEIRTIGESHSDDAPAGPCAVIGVRDSGVGMDEATLARAFEPFFTTKGQHRGTGLGLSMVYGFVRQSGGTVRTHSRPGEGTTFELLFPLTAEEVSRDRSAELNSPFGGLSGRVLVCEDEPSVRRMVSKVLREAGLSVVETDSAQQALQAAADSDVPFDLLLTDVVMPQTTGPQLARQLCPEHADMEVLYVTGYPGKELARRSLGVPPDRTLLKPFSSRQLIDAVRPLLPAAGRPDPTD